MYHKRSIRRRHRGISSVLAMLYLTLFSALAVGFYASVNTAVQVSYNDQRGIQALAGADSGLDFMRYQLAHVDIDPNTPSTQVIDQMTSDLSNHLNGTLNMRGMTVGRSGNIVNIPNVPGAYINLDSTGTSSFRATITDWAGEVVVKITGRYATPSMQAAGTQTLRTITMDFTRKPIPTNSFNYAVASKGSVVMSKGAVLATDPSNNGIATIMSASATPGAIAMSGGAVGGDLNVVSGGGASVTGGSVGGETSPSLIQANHVHTVSDPVFPVVDTTIYKQYATNTYVANASTQQNIRIPAGTNPRFAGGDTVRGIMYIESPNTVTFRGDFNLQGFIVFENAGTEAVNIMDFRGAIMQNPLPADPQFDVLRATTGVSILGPTSLVKMSGSTDSLLRGNLVLGQFSFQGSADVQIDRGTLMTLNSGANSTVFNGRNVKFSATGADNMPSQGLLYSSYFIPKPASYQEIMP